LFEWLLPLIIGSFILVSLLDLNSYEVVKSFRNESITLLGILAGFSITLITILTTGHSKNLDEIKTIESDIKINGQNISLYQVFLINFTYSVVTEVFLIIFNLIYPFFLYQFEFSKMVKLVVFTLSAMILVHVLLLTIRNMVNFYFTLLAKRDS
jgi:hypothetical protein